MFARISGGPSMLAIKDRALSQAGASIDGSGLPAIVEGGRIVLRRHSCTKAANSTNSRATAAHWRRDLPASPRRTASAISIQQESTRILGRPQSVTSFSQCEFFVSSNKFGSSPEFVGELKGYWWFVVRFSKVWEGKNNFEEKVAPPPYGDGADGNYFHPHPAIPCGVAPQQSLTPFRRAYSSITS